MTISDKPTITLQKLTADSARAFMKLEVADSQKNFVAPNAVSIAEAYSEEYHWMRGIYTDDEPVGLIQSREA